MEPLIHRYDALVCDLDGVVYRGKDPVPYAVESLNAARTGGVGIAYATNNASRPPEAVADHLRRLGVDAAGDAVVNSAQAGAAALAQNLDEGSVVLAIGGDGVTQALRERGFQIATDAAAGDVAAVLQGYGAAVSADQLAEAAYAIQGGARWVATNTDLTLPTARGTAPGNGSLVAAVRCAVQVDPEVVGKPGALMYTMAADRLRSTPERTLAIGDRLETDVAGATAAGMDCLHVLTGVHGPADLAAAPPALRPRFVAADLRALREPYDEPVRSSDGRMIRYTCGTTSAHLAAGDGGPNLVLEGGGNRLDRLRVSLRVLWAALDAGTVEQAAARSLIAAAH